MVLLGDRAEADRIRPAFARLRIDIEWLPGIALPSNTDPAALVVVSLEKSPRLAEPLKALRSATEIPIFVVTGSWTSDASARRLYAAGVDGVFEWPSEARLIARFVAEMLALRFVRGRPNRPDAALARNVRAHLKLITGLTTLPHVETRDGVVRLSGQVDRLRLAREVDQVVMRIPGVRSLDLNDLNVVPQQPATDAQLRRAARRLLSSSSDFDPSTLMMSVEGGRLRIDGSIPSRSQARTLEERAAGILGLRAIENRAQVSRTAHRVDRGVARRLRSQLTDLFPEADVRVSFFEGTAVLAGGVPDLRTRREIVELVGESPSVERIVDKLDVGD